MLLIKKDHTHSSDTKALGQVYCPGPQYGNNNDFAKFMDSELVNIYFNTWPNFSS